MFSERIFKTDMEEYLVHKYKRIYQLHTKLRFSINLLMNFAMFYILRLCNEIQTLIMHYQFPKMELKLNKIEVTEENVQAIEEFEKIRSRLEKAKKYLVFISPCCIQMLFMFIIMFFMLCLFSNLAYLLILKKILKRFANKHLNRGPEKKR